MAKRYLECIKVDFHEQVKAISNKQLLSNNSFKYNKALKITSDL